MKKILLLLVILFTFFLISGCEAIFTNSPIAKFAPSASELPPAQLAAYANSVPPEEAAAVLAILADTLSDMPADDPLYGELNQAAGTLALSAAGLSLSGIIEGMVGGSSTLDINDTVAAVIVASAYFDKASEAGETLTSSDMILTGLGLAIDAAGGDVSTIVENDIKGNAEAYAYIQAGAEGDPSFANFLYDTFGFTFDFS